MQHPDLASLLRRRLEVIADLDWRDRDPDGQFSALKKVSEGISSWHAEHKGTLSPRLDHFLTGCSFDKALRLLETDGNWTGH